MSIVGRPLHIIIISQLVIPTHKHHASNRNTTPQPLPEVFICLSNLPKWKKSKFPVRNSVLINLPGLGDIRCSSARWPIMSPYSLNREKPRVFQLLEAHVTQTSSLPMACGLLMTLPQHLRWMIGTTTGTMQTRPGANVEEL